MTRDRRRWEFQRWGAVAGCLGALLAGGLSLTPFVQSLELRSQNLRFRLRGHRETRAKIVIVEISASTLAEWPGPQSGWGAPFAAAVREARRRGAGWIGFDLRFTGMAEGEGLEAFRTALSDGKVVLASWGLLSVEPGIPADALLFAHREQPVNTGFIDTPERDGRVQRALVYLAYPDKVVPSLPAVLALRTRGQSPEDAAALRGLADTDRDAGGTGGIWINYLGPPGPIEQGGSFHYIAMERLVRGDLTERDRQWLRDATVLIGRTDRGANEQVRGPWDAPYHGVEVHAHTLATLLDRLPLRRSSVEQEALAAVALGLGVAAALSFLSIGQGFGLTAALMIAWSGLAQIAFGKDALWPMAGPLLTLMLAWSGQSSARGVEEARRRRATQELFRRYVPVVPDYELSRQPEGTRGRGTEGEVSVLFLDIRNSTGAAQGQSPAAVMEELNVFFDQIVPVVEQHGGVVLQYTGDGLLALFGGPRPIEHHAQAAVEAAIAMAQVSRRFSVSRQSQGKEPMRIGCGINTGVVSYGEQGGMDRYAFTVVGDTVNVAARLEQLNKREELNQEFPSEIVIGGDTYDRLSQPPPTRGPFEEEIRGRKGRVRYYQVRVGDE